MRKRKTTKGITKLHWLLLLAFSLLAGKGQAQGPVQPEAMQFEPVDVTDVVNLATGDFVYTIPLMNVPGPEGGYPIVLSYHSGIGPNQPATWVGLGWTLNPGAINRTLSGYPDDYNGDLVVTNFNAESQGSWGLSIGAGWGPVGLNMTYDHESGKVGVNAIVSLGTNLIPGLENSPFSANIGASIGVYGNSGVDLSASVGYNTGNVSLGADISKSGISGSIGTGRKIGSSAAGTIGISAGTQGIHAQAGVSASGLNLVSIGGSLTSGGADANISVVGTGFNSVSSTSGGNYSASSFGFKIPLPYDFWISFGHSEWSWTLNETYEELSYGVLNPSTSGKNERDKHSIYLMPSKDAFNVSAQGVSGSFMQTFSNGFVLKDEEENDEHGYFENTWDANTFQSNPIQFRFAGEKSYNRVNEDGFLNWGHDYDPLDTERSTGKQITPIFGGNNKLEGFVIVNTDGMIYEFKQPSYNYYQYSESIQDNGGTEVTSLNSLNTAYATTWLLTAIKGSDYVDREAAGIDANDWGYWVKFNYKKEDNPQVWRAPFSGYMPGTDESVKSFSQGIRETYYLWSVETATHQANFYTTDSKNGVSPTLDFNENINPTVISSSAQEPVDGVSNTYTFEISGDYSWIGELNYLGQIIRAYHAYHKRQHGQCRPNWEGGDEYSITEVNYSPSLFSYNSWTNTTTFQVDIADATLGSTCYIETRAEILIGNVQNQITTRSKQLDRVVLGLNDLMSDDPEDEVIESDIISEVQLGYDYSLRENTNGSVATETDGADDGALTLKTVSFYGQNSILASPPYRFEYAYGDVNGSGFNPVYHANHWDRWGNYRYPENAGFRNHQPHQEKALADYAAAWSLTKITTPTGGNIEVEYESDDYYYVNDTKEYGYASSYEIGDPSMTSSTETTDVFHFSSADYEDANFYVGQEITFNKFVTCGIIEEGETPSNYSEELLCGDYVDQREKEIRYEITETDNTSDYIKIDGFENLIDSEIYSSDRVGVGVIPDPLLPEGVELQLDYRYSVVVFQDKTYGGGSRVRKISSMDGNTKNSTLYVYEDEDGLSTGATVTVPIPYTGLKYSVPRVPESYRRAYSDHIYSYGRPPAGVIYSSVKVMNVDEDENVVNGYTEYEFFTSKVDDYTYDIISEYWTLLRIDDRTGIHGQPKSVTTFEQITGTGGETQFRPLNKTEHLYSYSEELDQHANVLNAQHPLGISEGSSTHPLGVINEKHISKEALTNDEYREIRIEKTSHNVFNIGQVQTQYFYSDENSITTNSEIITKVRNIGFDMATGRALVTVTQTDKSGETNINKNTPAWWKYPDMEDKNMLTQTFENATYKTNVGIDDLSGLTSYLFPTDEVESSSVTTWAQWGGFDVWRKNDTYSYVPGFSYSAFPTNYEDYDDDGWKVASTSIPWEMASNVVQYDNFGHTIESVNKDGSYQSVKYDPENHSLVLAVASNAKEEEVIYKNFEEDEYHGSNPFTGEGRYDATETGKSFAVPATPNFEGKYKVGVWVQGYPKVNGVNLPAATNGWEYYQTTVSAGGTVTLSTDDVALFDDLTIIPEYASVSYFAYDPVTWNVTAMTGPDHRTTFFEYDDAGRLMLTKDFEGNIISKNEYGYGNDIYVERPDYIETTVNGATEEITFEAMTSNSTDIVKYIWDFGDGGGFESTTTNEATHSYAGAGIYELVLTTIDSEGNTRRLIEEVSVRNPVAVALLPSQEIEEEGEEGELTTVWTISVSPDISFAEGTLSYFWEMSVDGGISFSTNNIYPSSNVEEIEVQFFSHHYDDGDQIYFRLNVTDALGRQGEQTIDINLGTQFDGGMQQQ